MELFIFVIGISTINFNLTINFSNLNAMKIQTELTPRSPNITSNLVSGESSRTEAPEKKLIDIRRQNTPIRSRTTDGRVISDLYFNSLHPFGH